jgi:hypothetical protein
MTLVTFGDGKVGRSEGEEVVELAAASMREWFAPGGADEAGPPTGQATPALSRRWSATARPYEPRRSTPRPTTRGRTLSFQRTSTTKGKVGP